MNNREEISSTRVRWDMSSNNALERQSGRQSTVKDIAKLAGVSTATVSRVVNGSGTGFAQDNNEGLDGYIKSAVSPQRACRRAGAREWRYSAEAWHPHGCVGKQESQAI